MKQVDQEKLDQAFARLLKLSLLREAKYRRAQLVELKKLEQESKPYSPTPIGDPASVSSSEKFTKEHEKELIQLMALATQEKIVSNRRPTPRALYYSEIRHTPNRPTKPRPEPAVYSDIRVQDTADLLTEWARWCRVGDPRKLIGYPMVSNFARMLGVGSLPTPMITDDQAMAVNTAVCRLLKRHPLNGKSVMTFYFLYKRSFREVAKREGISKIEAQLRVNSGTNWIDAFLDREAL